jgi:hypothetical protein
VPVSATVTCPNGSAATATGTDLAAATTAANAACPAPKAVSITPANGAVVPQSVTEVTLVTDSTLDPASLTAANVKVMLGTVPAAGSVAAVGTNGVKFVLSGPALYGQPYTFNATVKDTLGKTLTATATFTTTGKACAAPTFYNPTLDTCEYPAGVKVSTANTLPQGCTSPTQQCWKDAITNGTVKLIATPATMTGYSDRPLLFAYFKNTSTANGVTGLWNTLPVYADDVAPIGGDIAHGVYEEIDWVYGTSKGIIFHDNATHLCYEMVWYPPTTQPGANSNVWANTTVACPQ